MMEPVLILGEHSGSVGAGGGGSGMSTPQERPSRKSSWSSHSEPLLDLPVTPVDSRDAQAEYERKRAQMSAPGNRGGGGILQWFFRASLECVAATVQRVAAATAFARISFPTGWSSAATGRNDAIGSSSHHLLLDPTGGDEDGSSPGDVGDAAGERGLLLDDVEGGGDGASSQSPYELMVDIEPESNSVLRSSPRILSDAMLEQLTKRGLPASVGMKRWTRLYSVIRDGDSFGTFLHNVRNHKHTVIVVKTMDHEVFGGFADTEWERHSGIEMAQFYGTGQSFLFSFVGAPSAQNVSIYKWTGANTYNQLCDVENATVAMGGGGTGANFGLCIQDYFRKGSTGPCDTYGNAPLATKEFFDILAFEVYGFVNAW